ncbi:MAG: hypothetical protein LBS40_03260 [Burkholderiales bacterium]|jgi:predicted outer membrane repeat protein|nr:hypothetical protein [Burkholderiales bacterium]
MKKSAADSNVRLNSTLRGAVFGKKSERHQKPSTLPWMGAKHYKKVWLSAFVAAMLCMGVTAQAATIMVNDPTDGSVAGKCTLRDAVAAVNTQSSVNSCAAGDGSNDTITFDSAVFNTSTTIVVSPEIEIKKDLTIEGLLDGNDDPLITLDGNNANRILIAQDNAITSLTFSGLTFQKGKAVNSSGGAIYVYGITNVTINNSVFDQNQAEHGGAIYVVGTNVTINNSVFTNNKTNNGSGGAINASLAYFSALNISNSRFDGNRSDADGGGAIRSDNVNIIDSVFTNNYAYYSGGALDVSNVTRVNNSVFTNNRADKGGGGALVGQYFSIDNSVFTNNYAYYSGGALVSTQGSVYVSNSVFRGNHADDWNYGGGAIELIQPKPDGISVSNSVFIDNWTNGSGGAIYSAMFDSAVSGGIKAHHLTLVNNSAGNGGAAINIACTGTCTASGIIVHNSLIVSENALTGASAFCYGDRVNITGSHNIEWVDGADVASPSCGADNQVSANSFTFAQIVSPNLADNGGPTPSLALPAGSPAIGAVDPSGVTSQMFVIDSSQIWSTGTWVDATLDQRGVARATTAAERSLGAFEYKAPSPPPPPPPIPVLPAPLALLLALGLAGVGFRGQRTED